MLKNSLVFNQVVLPGPPEMWTAPLDLTLALQEVLLIDRIGPDESAPFLKVASSLRPPVAGEVLHWDLNAFSLSRQELYHLRRRIAYLAPGQVLLSRLTLGQNIALGISFQEGTSYRSVLAGHTDLLERLALQPFLALWPQDVAEEVYVRALWARELIKEPELIVAVLDGAWEPLAAPSQGILLLQDYLAHRRGAALLLGQSLQDFHPLASRLLRRESGRLISHPLSDHPGRPLTDFLPLVLKEE